VKKRTLFVTRRERQQHTNDFDSIVIHASGYRLPGDHGHLQHPGFGFAPEGRRPYQMPVRLV
jgi:hypothetical protein